MKILLPVDGSDHTRRMLAWLANHEKVFGSEHDYVAFTAVTPIPPHAAKHVAHLTLDDYYRDMAEAVLKPVREFAEGHHWKLRTAYLAGRAADTIAKFAEAEKPDLVVMGSHGQSSLVNVLLGSVATGVLARCKSPVLLIR
jgi:nucleotide-binding universal stress UspA family protein